MALEGATPTMFGPNLHKKTTSIFVVFKCIGVGLPFEQSSWTFIFYNVSEALQNAHWFRRRWNPAVRNSVHLKKITITLVMKLNERLLFTTGMWKKTKTRQLLTCCQLFCSFSCRIFSAEINVFLFWFKTHISLTASSIHTDTVQ